MFAKFVWKIRMSKMEKKEVFAVEKEKTIGGIFRLLRYAGKRIQTSLKGKSKQPSSKECLRIDIDTNRKWIISQFTPEMKKRNFEMYLVRPIGLFIVCNSFELKEAFN